MMVYSHVHFLKMMHFFKIAKQFQYVCVCVYIFFSVSLLLDTWVGSGT